MATQDTKFWKCPILGVSTCNEERERKKGEVGYDEKIDGWRFRDWEKVEEEEEKKKKNLIIVSYNL